MKRLPVLKIAVVGHTNTGKTSLLRTLTRNAGFGAVSNRPATTRHVEGASLLVDGVPLIELYDTPGLEDSIGLLELLDKLNGGQRRYGIELIEQFLVSPAAKKEFEQEAKALRQVLASDIALYVIDARDRIMAKHRDELEILARCTKPVVPVLNFIASPVAKTAEWREHLAKVNLHAVVEFDTVVVDEYGERRLFEKMQTLLDRFYPTLQAVIDDRQRQRTILNRTSAELLADLLLDAAAYRIILPVDIDKNAAMTALKQRVREREQQCVDGLLELFRFRLDDYDMETLPIKDGQWGIDLFNPASLKQFGVRASRGAAAGAVAGLAIDAAVGGASLGAGAAIGATIGALLDSSRTHGKRLADYFRGFTELRVNDETLRLLAVRQIELVRALFRRGHASQEKIRLNAKTLDKAWTGYRLPRVLEDAKVNPAWSRLNGAAPETLGSDISRLTARETLAQLIETSFSQAAG